MYTDIVLDHFMHPRNVGEIPDADGVGSVGNPVCGDMMTFYIKVQDGRIADVKFKTFGCERYSICFSTHRTRERNDPRRGNQGNQ